MHKRLQRLEQAGQALRLGGLQPLMSIKLSLGLRLACHNLLIQRPRTVSPLQPMQCTGHRMKHLNISSMGIHTSEGTTVIHTVSPMAITVTLMDLRNPSSTMRCKCLTRQSAIHRSPTLIPSHLPERPELSR